MNKYPAKPSLGYLTPPTPPMWGMFEIMCCGIIGLALGVIAHVILERV